MCNWMVGGWMGLIGTWPPLKMIQWNSLELSQFQSFTIAYKKFSDLHQVLDLNNLDSLLLSSNRLLIMRTCTRPTESITKSWIPDQIFTRSKLFSIIFLSLVSWAFRRFCWLMLLTRLAFTFSIALWNIMKQFEILPVWHKLNLQKIYMYQLSIGFDSNMKECIEYCEGQESVLARTFNMCPKFSLSRFSYSATSDTYTNHI